MTMYRFSGKIELGRETSPFEREVEADSLKHGKEKVLSQLGSEHSVPRSKIVVEEEEEV